MRKIISLALAVALAFALVIPAAAAVASTAPAADFINGTVVTTDKNGYKNFDGKEITANNSTFVFDKFTFVADNKVLNAWYIDVTDDISGTLEVAYKIGSAYYIVTFDINGPGKYWIADSKGANGANSVKIGAFTETGEEEDELFVMDIAIVWGSNDNFGGMTVDEAHALLDEILASGAFDFVLHLTNGYGDVFLRDSIWSPFGPGEVAEFEFDPACGSFEYDGYVYTWQLDWLDGTPGIYLNDDKTGVSFSADPADTPITYYLGADGIWYHEVELIFYFAMDRTPIEEPPIDQPMALIMSVWAMWGSYDDFGGLTGAELEALYDDIFASGAFDFTVHLTNGYGDVFNARWIEAPFGPGEVVEFEFDPASGSFVYDGYLYTWYLDWLDGTAGIDLNADKTGVSFSADPADSPATPGVVVDGIQYYDVELIFYFAMDRTPIEQPPVPKTYYIEAGGIWAEWGAYIENGGALAVDMSGQYEFYYVVVFDPETEDQVTGYVYFWVTWDNNFWTWTPDGYNPWFTFFWDGDQTVLVTFFIEE